MSLNVNASKPKKWIPQRMKPLMFPVMFTLLALFLAFLFGYIPATNVVGTEFNTSTWSIREFQYRREPFSKIQLTGVVREVPKSVLSSNSGFPFTYLKNRPVSSRWDLAEIRNGRYVTEGPAKILITYLQATKHLTTDFWPDWSTKNSAKADILWPAVRDLVDIELYNELPSIMEMALVECSDAEFKSTVENGMVAALQKQVAALTTSSNKAADLKLAEELLEKYQKNR